MMNNIPKGVKFAAKKLDILSEARNELPHEEYQQFLSFAIQSERMVQLARLCANAIEQIEDREKRREFGEMFLELTNTDTAE
jgi:hypothetical protein